MVHDYANAKLLTQSSVRDFFQSRVCAALDNQKIEADVKTVYYVVNLLTSFTRTDQLYERTPDGVMIRPLASLYSEAVNGESIEARNKALQRLGDVALFVAGVFSHSLNRKVVDVDYYVSMGGGAYGHLSQAVRGSANGQVFSEIFDELSFKFVEFVDVLAEVSERSPMRDDRDIMRLYELWLRTGSKRAARRLREIGIQPCEAAVSRARH